MFFQSCDSCISRLTNAVPPKIQRTRKQGHAKALRRDVEKVPEVRDQEIGEPGLKHCRRRVFFFDVVGVDDVFFFFLPSIGFG